MTPSNQIPAVCNYGTSAVYSDYPSPEQMRAGVVPLDSLPAAWWNKMWCASNCAINEARDMVGQIITEVNNVLCQAGINPQAACTDQLYQSINKIRQTLATASVPGAVVSSSVASEVAVDPTTGRMSVNCLGNAASLSTSASTVVGAINELKSTYDCCFSDTATALNGKAPTSHASSATTYGVGNADSYGHLKISDTYTSVLAACSGVAASQKALACVYAVACAAAAGNISLGNTAGCALGTAAAGTATTAARSDHVHPKPTRSELGLGTAADCAAGCFRPSTWTPSLVSCSCYNYIDAYTASADRGVVLTCAVTAAGQYQTLGPSTSCKFTFNPATGEAKAKTFTGALAGCACCAGALTDVCDSGSTVHLGYACAGLTCAQIANFAMWSTSYVAGKRVIKDASKATVQSYLGLGSAAYCDASCFRPSTWYPDSLWQGSVCRARFALSASSAVCGGTSCTFGERVVGRRNAEMRQWSVTWQGVSAEDNSAPMCDIYKAICWAMECSKFVGMQVVGYVCGGLNPNQHIISWMARCDNGDIIFKHGGNGSDNVLTPTRTTGLIAGRVGGVY